MSIAVTHNPKFVVVQVIGPSRSMIEPIEPAAARDLATTLKAAADEIDPPPIIAKPLRPLAKLAQDSLDVQDACNLSGVVHAYAEALSTLWKWSDTYRWGTNDINTHPIAILWADKVAHLTGTQSFGHERVTAAYAAVKKLAEGGS